MAAQSSDVEAVNAVNLAYYRALSARDLGAMARVWSGEPDNILIAPPVNPVTHVGWDAISRNWERYWPQFAEYSVAMQVSTVNINGPVAWVHGIETAQRKTTGGQTSSSTNFGTNIFVNQNGRWLMVFHQAVAMR
jgi:ketosteroid isomerase-like protein